MKSVVKLDANLLEGEKKILFAAYKNTVKSITSAWRTLSVEEK